MWEPDSEDGRLFHLLEECAEVIHAVSRMGRFGPNSRHEDNGVDEDTGKLKPIVEHVLKEIDDLITAIERCRPDLVKELTRIRKEEDREVVPPTRQGADESKRVGEEPGRETGVPPVRVRGDGEDQPS